jgi:gas vesicle protein
MQSQIRTATVHEIKDELQHLPPAKVVELCIKLSRFKKENKELLTYLLFESNDMEAYLELVKKETENLFTEINSTNLYFAKKTIRKILRIINKQIRFTGSKQAEAELLIHYCSCLKDSGIPFQKSNALANLYKQQLKKIEKAVEGMHEDLQYEYQRQLTKIQL